LREGCARKQQEGWKGLRPWSERTLVLSSDSLKCYVRAGGSVEDSWPLETTEVSPSNKKVQRCCLEVKDLRGDVVSFFLFSSPNERNGWLEAILSAKHANHLRLQAPVPEVNPRTTSRPMPPPGPCSKGEERLDVVVMAEASGAAGNESSGVETSSSEEEDLPESAHGSRKEEEELPRECNPMAEDYYDVLGVDRTASDKEIRKAYRRAALKHHPDKNMKDREAAEIRFKRIAEAFEILGNSTSREGYDMRGPATEVKVQRTPEEVWKDMFGEDDLDTIFSEWDPVWGRKMSRYKQKWRGDIQQLRPNRFGMGWQVAATRNPRFGGRARTAQFHAPLDQGKQMTTRRVGGGLERVETENLVENGREVRVVKTTFIAINGASETSVQRFVRSNNGNFQEEASESGAARGR